MNLEPIDDEPERLEDLSVDDLIVALHFRTHQLASVLRTRAADSATPTQPAGVSSKQQGASDVS
jgi:hypothetical protein